MFPVDVSLSDYIKFSIENVGHRTPKLTEEIEVFITLQFDNGKT